MSSVQIYYICSDRLKTILLDSGIDLDMSVRFGEKSMVQVYNEIKNDPYFCRGEESIDYKYFLGLIRSDITLYTELDGKVSGALNFVFNQKDGERIINFNGICSPIKYTGLGIGEKLINSLIRIAKQSNTKYIFLDCKGKIMEYYRDRFGFDVTKSKKVYDSDEESNNESDNEDDNNNKMYYFMRLDLSKVSGGYRKKKRGLKKTNKRRKRKNVTRKKN